MQNTYMNKMLQRIADAVERWTGGSITIDVTGAGDMQGATASAAGAHGLVPAPAAGDEDKVLSGAGTWIDAGSDVAELGDLEDVTITSPASGESLKYDGAKWVNGNVTAELPDFIEETSGSIVTVNAAERPAKSLVVAINPVQSGSGDPSPDNIRPISGWTGCNVVVSPTTDAEDGTTYTIHFPSEAGTVYGGTLDVANGTLTVDKAMVDLGTLTWKYVASAALNFRAAESIGAKPPENPLVKPNAICSIMPVLDYTAVSTPIDGITVIFATSIQAGKLWAHSGTYTDVTSFKAAMTGQQFVYELATPITYQLTPTEVQMLLGTNNLWADTGKITELKYINQTYNDLLEEVSGESSEVEYSTTEHKIGKWVDGSDLYEKTIVLSSLPSTIGYNTINHGIADVDFIFLENATLVESTGQTHIAPYGRGGTEDIEVTEFDKTSFLVWVGLDRSSWSAYITVRYTKL